MGAREVLQFILETDASGAVKGFKAVGDEADKSLGKAEKKADSFGTTMTKVGAVVAGAGIAVGAGLVGTVKAFEKSEAAANKFQTAVSGMGSKIDTGRITRLATDLQQVSTVTNEQVVAAARWGAVYGLTTDQLEELLRASVDLAAQTGKTVDQTTRALAKAASGEGFTALTKMGLTFDETAYKADAFGTTVAESTAFAGGAAAKNVDTMSGQLARLGNNWSDVKEQIGAGANEVFEPMARGAADLMENLAQANPALLQTVGHFSAVGSVAATTFGTLASVGGQVANIREGVDALGISFKNADGSATKFGSAMKGIGLAVGSVAAAAAAGEITAGILNTIQNRSGKAETALNRLASASAGMGKNVKGAGNDAVQAFAKLTDNQPLSLATAWESFGEQIRISIGGTEFRGSVEQADRAFKSLLDQDPSQAKDFLKAFEDFTGNMDESAAGFDTNTSQIKEWRGQLKAATDAQHDQGVAAAEAANEMTGLDTAMDETKTTAQRFAAALGDGEDILHFWQTGATAAAAGAKAFSEELETVDTDELITGATDLGDALKGVTFNMSNLPKSFDDSKASMGKYSEEQVTATKALTDWGDAAKGQLTAMIDSKVPYDEVIKKSNDYRTSLALTMAQAGFTTGQIDAYLETLGLTPAQVDTAITLSKDEEAKTRLTIMQGALDNLDEGAQAEIYALMAGGDWQAADKKLAEYARGVRVPITVEATAHMNESLRKLGWPVPGGKAAPAAGPTTTAAVPMAMAAPITNISITLPAGSTPATTLSAIRRYQRLGGDMGGLLDTVAAIR